MTSQSMIFSFHSTVYEIPNTLIQTMKALIISDLHISQYHPSYVSIPDLLIRISSLVVKHDANTILILGDVFEGFSDKWEDDSKRFFDGLNNIPVTTFIILGNHDRNIQQNIMQYVQYSNICCITDLLFKMTLDIVPNDSISTIFFAHDIGNNLALMDQEVPLFINGLKEAFSNIIKPKDFLLIGHTHRSRIYKDTRCGSISTFSYDCGYKEYAILRAENTGFHIDFYRKDKLEESI